MTKKSHKIKCPVCGATKGLCGAGYYLDFSSGYRPRDEEPGTLVQDFTCSHCDTEWSVEYVVTAEFNKEEITKKGSME